MPSAPATSPAATATATTSATEIKTLPNRPADAHHALLADLLLVAIVLITYASVVIIPYGFLDDYPILAASLQHDPFARNLNMSMGRPLASFIMDTSFRF